MREIKPKNRLLELQKQHDELLVKISVENNSLSGAFYSGTQHLIDLHSEQLHLLDRQIGNIEKAITYAEAQIEKEALSLKDNPAKNKKLKKLCSEFLSHCEAIEHLNQSLFSSARDASDLAVEINRLSGKTIIDSRGLPSKILLSIANHMNISRRDLNDLSENSNTSDLLSTYHDISTTAYLPEL